VFQRFHQTLAGNGIAALAAKCVEVDLVQDDRARGDQFLALHAVDFEHRRRGPFDCRQPRLYRVQPTRRTAVVVFVVTDQQFVRQTIQPVRLEQ
jgi:hypothetical protein